MPLIVLVPKDPIVSHELLRSNRQHWLADACGQFNDKHESCNDCMTAKTSERSTLTVWQKYELTVF